MNPAGRTPETPTDILVGLARGGNNRAFELLVERHRVRLFAAAMRHGRDYDDANDVCQEALARAWSRLATLDHPRRFGAWLEQIVIHLSLDFQRRQSARARRSVSLERIEEQGEDPALDSSSPEARRRSAMQERILEQEIAAQLLRSIDQLPETLREAAFLRFVEGLTLDQIAGRLGLSYEAAKKRVARAVGELRSRLQALYDELLGTGSS